MPILALLEVRDWRNKHNDNLKEREVTEEFEFNAMNFGQECCTDATRFEQFMRTFFSLVCERKDHSVCIRADVQLRPLLKQR